MSDLRKGLGIEETRAWLDRKGFVGKFVDWESDALLGADKDYVLSKFTDRDEGERLWGLLNTARTSSSSNQVPSPRLGDHIYVLLAVISNQPRLLGTAWVVASLSGRLLLTAYHCLIPAKDNLDALYVIESITLNSDGSTTLSPVIPIQVEALDGDSLADIAVLRATTVFPRSIPLCPAGQYPSSRSEDQVKSYHCPTQMFTEGQIDSLCPMATNYEKVKIVTNHHIYITGEHMHGSSGGVIVDTAGRAVGLICSGYVPGVKLPLPDSFQTLWETVTALSEGLGTFTKGVKLSTVGYLEAFLNSH